MELDMMSKNELTAAEKAWELARIIFDFPSNGGMTYDDIAECFDIPKVGPTTAVFRMPYEEALKKYNTWLKKHRNEIRIGDEVESEVLGVRVKMVVTKMYPVPNDVFGSVLNGISSDGSVYTCRFSDAVKTGNHWDYLDDYCSGFSGLAT